MVNDDDKVVDLKQFKRRRSFEADRQLKEAIWEVLVAVWAKYAEEASKVPPTPEGLSLATDPGAIFLTLLGDLVSLAQAHGADNEDLIEILCLAALTHCEPKGRLYELLDRAFRLLQYGDEEGEG
jgi:hypothetical protein